MAKSKTSANHKNKKAYPVPKKRCGIVMPISAIDGCSELHWADVLEILTDAIEDAGFDANMVSNADEIGIIQKRIIQNLYDNPVVVCDVSGKNPNVMFELGLRLAFDKPTIIVKDDKTSYSFDTSPIEHLEYPRDLRFATIVGFKQKLSEKIKATHEKATADASYTTFLKHFGEFKVAKLEEKEVSGQEYILEELKNVRLAMRRLESNRTDQAVNSEGAPLRRIADLLHITYHVSSYGKMRRLGRYVSMKFPFIPFKARPIGEDQFEVTVHLKPDMPVGKVHAIRRGIERILRS